MEHVTEGVMERAGGKNAQPADRGRLREMLEELAEPGYQQFASRLLPNVDAKTVLGVRLPKLRKIAREIAGTDWRSYLENASDDSLEEIMMQGMVIGYADMAWEELTEWIRWFLPKIDNWSVCDSFCSGLKKTKKHPEEMWTFVSTCMRSGEVYTIRFGVVMALDYFAEEAYAREAFLHFDEITCSDYYVKMAVAWAVSVYYIKVRTKTAAYLKENKLDNFTYNKALQKITESSRIDEEEKVRIRSMKRSAQPGAE